MTDFADHLQTALGTNYQLERELSGGGMSRVFVATERSLGRKVVVKVLPPELAAGVNRDRFRREIQVAAQLQHPHIVPLLSAGEQGDLLWYTMPYIEGESLRAALERQKSFGAREVTRVLHDVVDALAFAHERGVIHRDIKPANILTQGSHALVTDFGVAKAISAALPFSGVTSAGIAIGTPAYMAPEQLAGDSSADHRMDIYAVGLLAYELCTGASPFSGPSPRETLAAQLTRDPQPLHEALPGIPRTLSDLIMRCLAKDPDKRPQRATDVLFELDSMTMPLGVTPQQGTTLPKKSRRHLVAIAGVISVVALAAVAYVTTRQQSLAPTPPTAPTSAATKRDTSKPFVANAAGTNSTTKTLPPPKPARALITHDDSLRIAEAVRKKVEAAKAKDSITKAHLAEETERKMTDSIIAANSGGAASSTIPVRRVVIAEPPDQAQWPEATLLGRAVADSLRRMLKVRRTQFIVVDQDSVRGALTRARDVNEIRKTLSADLILSIRLQSLKGDSAMLMIQSIDYVGSGPFRGRTATGRPGPKSQVLANLDQVLLSTLASLDEMARAPVRRGPPGAPPPPAERD
jgi:serine/threonine protein kinase